MPYSVKNANSGSVINARIFQNTSYTYTSVPKGVTHVCSAWKWMMISYRTTPANKSTCLKRKENNKKLKPIIDYINPSSWTHNNQIGQEYRHVWWIYRIFERAEVYFLSDRRTYRKNKYWKEERTEGSAASSQTEDVFLLIDMQKFKNSTVFLLHDSFVGALNKINDAVRGLKSNLKEDKNQKQIYEFN